MTNEKYKYWSLDSIYYQAMNDGAIYLSLPTWYFYLKSLRLKRQRISSKYKKYDGLRAEKPKQIIHMDTTQFFPDNHTKVYIYLIVDNFSRFIMSWAASTKCLAEISLTNLKRAFYKHLQKENTDLLTDDGKENKGPVEDFVNNPNIDIRKLIAGKDIRFSNSMVEAANKKLKYQHLFTRKLIDFEHTEKYLEKAIPEYNNMPSGVHFGLSLKQVFDGAIPNRKAYQLKIKSALMKIIKSNKVLDCQVTCSGL